MTSVELGPHESFESLVRRWKQGVQNSGVLREARRRRHYISPGERRRIKAKESRRRLTRRRAYRRMRGLE